MPDFSYNKNIIIALDYLNQADAEQMVNQLDPALCRVKVGKALFTATGPDFIKWLIDKNFDVFLDLKYHDIPNQLYNACLVAANLGVWMLTVHTMGGIEMLKAAKEGSLASTSKIKPLIMGVTLLTSIDDATLSSIGITESINNQVLKLANLAFVSQIDGVVCSGQEASLIKSHYKNLKLVTPGIRITNAHNDQKRVMTPKQAIMAGSDYLVIGRDITSSSEPIKVLEKIIVDLT